MDVCKEIPCTKCIKSDVCNKKSEFMKIIEQIPNVNIGLGKIKDDDSYSMKELKYFDYVYVEIFCKYRLGEEQLC